MRVFFVTLFWGTCDRQSLSRNKLTKIFLPRASVLLSSGSYLGIVARISDSKNRSSTIWVSEFFLRLPREDPNWPKKSTQEVVVHS